MKLCTLTKTAHYNYFPENGSRCKITVGPSTNTYHSQTHSVKFFICFVYRLCLTCVAEARHLISGLLWK